MITFSKKYILRILLIFMMLISSFSYADHVFSHNSQFLENLTQTETLKSIPQEQLAVWQCSYEDRHKNIIAHEVNEEHLLIKIHGEISGIWSTQQHDLGAIREYKDTAQHMNVTLIVESVSNCDANHTHCNIKATLVVRDLIHSRTQAIPVDGIACGLEP